MNLQITDGVGIYGTVFHYAAIIFFFGTACLVFLYLWFRGRLDMDESPKYQMMEKKNDDR